MDGGKVIELATGERQNFEAAELLHEAPLPMLVLGRGSCALNLFTSTSSAVLIPREPYDERLELGGQVGEASRGARLHTGGHDVPYKPEAIEVSAELQHGGPRLIEGTVAITLQLWPPRSFNRAAMQH